MLTIYILAWSAFTVGMGAAGTIFLLLAFRMLVGVAQAGAYPTAANMVAKWMPVESRGAASGIVSLGGRVGGSLAMGLSGFVIVWLTPADAPVEVRLGDVMRTEQLADAMTASKDRAKQAVCKKVWETAPAGLRSSTLSLAEDYRKWRKQQDALPKSQRRPFDGTSAKYPDEFNKL